MKSPHTPPTDRRAFLRAVTALAFAAPSILLASSETYVVRKGDTLTKIAARYGTTVGDIKRENGLNSDMIRVGQRLIVPAFSDAVASVRESTRKIKVDHRKWKYIVAHHSATPHGNAKSYDRVDRRHGMENGLAYHFVIGNGRDSKDGEIEIGSRWTKQIHGGHVSKWEYNNHGIGICLVGNFEEERPTRKQLGSLKQLMTYLGKDLLDGRYKFYVHKEINPTLCPGRHFPTREMHKIFG